MCVALALTGLVLPLFAKGDVKLFENGKSDAVIVVDDKAAPNAKYAAKELRDYVKKISGVELPIQNNPGKEVNIFVGEGAGTQAAGLTADKLQYDGFRIETRGNNLYIFGRDRKEAAPLVGHKIPFEKIHMYNKKLDICAFGEAGTLYGVYDLLRKYCGVRWYMPGEIGEVVPRRTSLTLPEIKREKSPDFYYRTAFWGLFDNNPEASIWYRRAGYGAPFPVQINHSFFYLNRYQKTNPEFFAMIDGKRDFNISCERAGNLCLSQPGVLKAFVDDARNYFDKYPDMKIFPVMPNDWCLRICDCAECQKQADYQKPDRGKFSNYVWGFVNKVAKEVGKTHPDRLIGCCAYERYAMVPDRVKLEPNVAVMFTKSIPWRFDENYRIRNGVYALEWATVTKNLFTWDYYCWDMTNSHLSGLPVAFSKWIGEDIKKFKGVSQGMFIDGGATPSRNYMFTNPEINHLHYYLTGLLLWDSDQDVNALLEDYYTNFYGPAAPEMKKFWTRAEEIWTDLKITKRGPNDPVSTTLYTPAVLNELKGYLEAAQKKAAKSEIYTKRIAGIQNLFYPYVDKVCSTRSKIPSYIVKRTAEKPVIDGKRDNLWRRANVMDFVLQNDAKPPQKDTFVRMLHDDENLYILVNAFEPNRNALVAKAASFDSLAYPYIWDDDAVEIFIVPDLKNLNRMAQILINCKGVVADGCFNTKQFAHPDEFKYNTGLVCKAGLDQNGWVLEMAIPLKSLDLDGVPAGKNWKFNIGRDRPIPNSKEIERSCWSSTLCTSWNVPVRFGSVVLE